jgi:ribosomal protein S18 acetylase RimI-like enzyme
LQQSASSTRNPCRRRSPFVDLEESTLGARVYASLAAVEERHFWFRSRNRSIASAFDSIRAALKAGYRTLEIGCGTGNWRLRGRQMPVEADGVRISTLDTDHFGVVTARADGVSASELPSVQRFCAANEVELLIARCTVGDTAAANAMIANDFLLMDTLVYYGRDLVAFPSNELVTEPAEQISSSDLDQVASIARECFQNYSGHYHADLRLNRQACTEVYVSWARTLCEADTPDVFVLVSGPPGRRTGFSAFRLAADRGELVLGAVLPVARGQDLYRQLTVLGMRRLQAMGARRFITSTQLSNWAAQASWVRAGLRPTHAYYTFHRWFHD